MDEDSRFILAIHLSENRSSEEAVKVLRKALEVVGAKPEALASDGHHLYLEVYRKAYGNDARIEDLNTLGD